MNADPLKHRHTKSKRKVNLPKGVEQVPRGTYDRNNKETVIDTRPHSNEFNYF